MAAHAAKVNLGFVEKFIPSLGRLGIQKSTELRQAITTELERMGLDSEQMAGYVGANGG